MRRVAVHESPVFTSATVIAMALLLAFVTGAMFSRSLIGLRELAILLLVLLTGILVVVPSDRVLKLGLAGWILTFGFGWRTIHVTSAINVHPSEVLAWVLFALVLARRIVRREPLQLGIPVVIPIMMVFGAVGLGTALARGDQLGAAIQESKILFVLVPCFYVVKWLIATRTDWQNTVWLSTLVATYISILGLADYIDPSLTARITGHPADQAVTLSVQGFERAGFVFFGSTAAVFVILTFLGFAMLIFLNSLAGGRLKLLIAALILSLELAAIYVSGYRGVWVAAAGVIAVFAFVQRRAWILLAGAGLALPLLPQDFFYRLESLFDMRYADSSQFKRLDRAQQGIELVLRSPLNGVGWGGSGYVHSDLIQLAANLGIPALVVFVVWLVTLARSMFLLAKREGWIGQYAGALLASLAALIVVLAGEGIIVWAQLMVPAWFLFALCYRLIDFASIEETNAAGLTLPVLDPTTAEGTVG